MLAQFHQRLFRQMRYSTIATFFLALTLSSITALAHAQQDYLSIKGSVVNIRAKPTTASDVAWELINGYPVQVMANEDEWIKVKDFEGTLGWVNKRFVSTEPHFIIKANSVNLRSDASTSSAVVGKLKKFDIVQTLDKRDDWAKVRTSSGQEGWILQSLAWGW